MTNKENKDKYINKFKKELSKYIQPTAGVDIQLFNSKDCGVVIKATLNRSGKRKSSIAGNFTKLGEAITSSGQRVFGGDLSNVNFYGTNTIFDGGSFFFFVSPVSVAW
ncbi:hypothetical protein, partial [Escherichia coli]|uniref:hypothetical protein n=1 Tax=Escherichia coli TaxID=562 RepID=UPI002118DAA7